MGRRLGEEIHKLTLEDNISGDKIVLFHRMPTSAERAAYSNEGMQRKGKKIEFKQAETREKYGMKILTGFRDGDFERQEGDKWVEISCDPAAPNYFEAWKEHIKQHACDLVQLLAAHVFDAPAYVVESDDEGDADSD